MKDKPTYEQLVMLLDACIPALEAAAKREANRVPKGRLIEVTERERLTLVKKIVASATA